VLFFAEACAVCWSETLFRAELGTDGRWRRENLTNGVRPDAQNGEPLAPIVSDGVSRFAAVWCVSTGGCGKRHDGSADTTPRVLLMSDDGGVSWNKLAQVPAGSVAVGFKDANVLVAVAAVPEMRFVLYPGGTASGKPTDDNIPSVPVVPGWQIVQTSDVPGGIANERSGVVSVTKVGDTPSRYFAFPGGSLQITGALSPTLLLGTAERSSKAVQSGSSTELGGFARLPVIVDLDAQTIAPIAGLVPSAEYSLIRPLLVVSGTFARVKTGGECLNVRADPNASSVSLGCFKDGVLLRLLLSTAAPTPPWLPVRTPDGRDGWANAEFLER
jgi:hypothetical protein